MDICDLSIHELHHKLKAKEVSSVEATRAMLARIEAVEPQIGSFITVTPEQALADAEAADRRIAAGQMDLLTGIPLALKDIFLTEGIRTTCGSRILNNFVPPYSATSWEKLKERGVVLLGKLNQDEFAMGSSNESSAFGTTRNPWDTDPYPGRFLGRFGGCRCRPPGHGHPGHRHRRFHPPAGLALRLCRPQADLRPRVALRCDCLCLFAGPGRSADPRCDRLRHHAGRAGRP